MSPLQQIREASSYDLFACVMDIGQQIGTPSNYLLVPGRDKGNYYIGFYSFYMVYMPYFQIRLRTSGQTTGLHNKHPSYQNLCMHPILRNNTYQSASWRAICKPKPEAETAKPYPRKKLETT